MITKEERQAISAEFITPSTLDDCALCGKEIDSARQLAKHDTCRDCGESK